jgi:hypothetical protein
MASLKAWAIVALCMLSIAAVPSASATVVAGDADVGHHPAGHGEMAGECDNVKDIIEMVLCSIL